VYVDVEHGFASDGKGISPAFATYSTPFKSLAHSLAAHERKLVSMCPKGLAGCNLQEKAKQFGADQCSPCGCDDMKGASFSFANVRMMR
jgi:hypothetical protein